MRPEPDLHGPHARVGDDAAEQPAGRPEADLAEPAHRILQRVERAQLGLGIRKHESPAHLAAPPVQFPRPLRIQRHVSLPLTCRYMLTEKLTEQSRRLNAT